MLFLEIKMGKITAGAYLLCNVENVNSVQQIGTGGLLIVNNYTLGLIWGNDSIYLFNSHSKDENGNVSSPGTAVFVKIDTLLSFDCTINAKTAIKFSLRKGILLARQHRDLKAEKRKYNDEAEQESLAVKMR